MSFDLSSLNPAQRDAASTIEGPVLILAGAGTGKTRVITYRMGYLISQGIAPSEILALTFTNKAAREMKERFGHLLGEVRGVDAKQAKKQLVAGTFHSFCVRVLREEIEPLGYGKNFTIYDQGDQLAVLKKNITKFGGKVEKLDPAKAQQIIGLSKNKGIPVEKLTQDDLVHAVARQYQQDLKLLNAVDFDDLLGLVVRLLREVPEARARLREKYKYLMVDEYQDTNALQLEIVRKLASDRHDVCVVGDDDQSIYSWRGAESGNILDFERFFPNPKVIRLEQNYRSTPNILEAANHVIQNNSRRRVKKLWSAAVSGEKIRVLAAPSDQEESTWIVEDLVRRRQEDHGVWEDFAVLYRVNVLSRPFEQELRRCRIPYRIIGGLGFYERREIKDVLAYVQTCMNPHDDISLLRIINTPARGIGAACIGILQENSRQRRHSVWQELQAPETPMSKKQEGALKDFADLIGRYGESFRLTESWAFTLETMLKEIGYYEDLQKSCKEAKEADSRMENVRELLVAMSAFQAQEGARLVDFLSSASLDREKEEDDKKEASGAGVTLMTLHSAKGLEFPHVYLVGMEEGYLPHERSKSEGNLDEERRLLYVGITRAMRSLTLTHCRVRKKYGKDEGRTPSSFLEELPQEGILQIDTGAPRPDLAASSAPNPFAALLSKLEAGGG